MCQLHSSAPTRRTLLAGAVALGAGAWRSSLTHAEVIADVKPPETPEAALASLYEGNARFAAGLPQAANRDINRLKRIVKKQTPFAAFLGCADSRVPIEFVFDQGLGDLFVTRIAGNVASSENVGSLEFGTLVLGAKVLYVLGHTRCGAVEATLKGEEVPGQISGLFQHIRPAVRQAAGDLDAAIKANVRLQAQVLAESSPVIARLVREKKLIVAGGVFDLESGKVEPVDVRILS
jgi:carbonic anhydrase